jgi:ethanolaminephosphotransferase
MLSDDSTFLFYLCSPFLQIPSLRIPEWFLALGTVGHALSVLSTSCLEEEHQIWYYWTTSFIFIMAVSLITDLRSSASTVHSNAVKRVLFSRPFLALVLLLGLCRVSRAWNQTGDKWKHLPDIGDWLLRSQ